METDEDAPEGIAAFAPAELQAILRKLPTGLAQVLRLRYGLIDGLQRMLLEVGRSFGLTRERIRQLEAEALQKLRAKLTGLTSQKRRRL